MVSIETALKQLAEDVKAVINERISKYGYNTRAKKNTLEGSDLQKTMEVKPTEDGIVLQIADYWEFISRGWVRTGNYPGTFSKFIDNLTKWVERKGITPRGNMTQNQLVFVIAKKIWYYGIHYRPFLVYDDDGDLSKMLPELNAIMDKWFELLFNQITEDLNNYFNG